MRRRTWALRAARACRLPRAAFCRASFVQAAVLAADLNRLSRMPHRRHQQTRADGSAETAAAIIG